jgi:hypothetical protein
VGAGVDVADGTAYNYPQTIVVPMKKALAKVKHTTKKKKA